MSNDRRIGLQSVARWLIHLAIMVTILAATAGKAHAQVTLRETPEAWFGTPLPPGLGEVPPVIIGDRGPVPVNVRPGDPTTPALQAASLRRDLATIVGFSRESRDTKEIGDGQLWGRIAGFPSSSRAIQWAVDEFRRAGIQNVELQSFDQDAGASMWLPLSWEIRLLGDPAFGVGSLDVVLESATPLSPSDIAGGSITAPLVYVGTASPAVLMHIDVRGKIAVQQITPQGHMVFERGAAVGRAQDLIARGAMAVVNAVKLPGNEQARDFSNCGGPCFNLGGRDGQFLESVLDAAAEAGVIDRLRMQISLQTTRRSGLSAENGVAVIPGLSEETIIINAHADAWYEGAGDNGDGFAVMLALARHFALPENQPERTLVFVASAGHHSTGLNGPRSFVAMNPELASRSVLALNLEHVAQRNFSPARSTAGDGYRETVADVFEAPIVAGVDNGSPFLNYLIARGVERYGVNFISSTSTMASGESGGYRGLGAAVVTVMQAPPLYHTSGEVLDVISAPGMERMARFFVYFINEVARAPALTINP